MFPKIFDLTGKVALVTGGSKGLGKAMARGFAEAGADIVISSRHAEELKPALEQILQGTKSQGKWFVADMNDRNQLKKLAVDAIQAFGRIDILVNNAGTNIPEDIAEITEENWDRVIELNLTSCALLTKEIVPQMKVRGWGRVIHMSSIMGLTSKAARNSYSATKSALIGLARASAADLGKYGINVNCIAPGPFLTDLPMSVLSPAEIQAFSDRTCVGRWGKPDELVGPALLLASDAGSYITGTTFLIDGGAMARGLG